MTHLHASNKTDMICYAHQLALESYKWHFNETAHCAFVTQIPLLLWECGSHLGVRWVPPERFHHLWGHSSLLERQRASFLQEAHGFFLWPLWPCLPLAPRHSTLYDSSLFSRPKLDTWGWERLSSALSLKEGMSRMRTFSGEAQSLSSMLLYFFPTWTIKFPIIFFVFLPLPLPFFIFR